MPEPTRVSGSRGSKGSFDAGIDLKLNKESVERVVKNLDILYNKMKCNKVIRPCLEKAVIPLASAIRRNASALSGGTKGVGMGLKIASSVTTWIPKNRRRLTYKICAGILGDEFVYWARHRTRHDTMSKYKKIDETHWQFRSGRSFIPTAIEYGHLTAKGTKTRPRPYIRTAKQQVYNRVIAEFADALEAEINQMKADLKDTPNTQVA